MNATTPASRPPFLTVILPCLNEEALLEGCVANAFEAVEREGSSAEVIVVDDGSTDRTAELARRLASADPRVRVQTHPRNLGVGRALSNGLAAARGTWAFIQCADEPFSMSDLGVVLSRLVDGLDVLVVRRKDRSANSFFRKVTSLTNYYLIRLLYGVKLGDFQFVQFYRVAAVRPFLPLASDGSFAPPELLIQCHRAGLHFDEIELTFHARRAGEAKYGSPRRLFQSVWEIVRFRFRRPKGSQS